MIVRLKSAASGTTANRPTGTTANRPSGTTANRPAARPPAARTWLLTIALIAAVPWATPAALAAQDLPPDTVSTLVTSEPLGGFGNIGGITIDAQGDLFMSNFRDAVWRISPDGRTRKLTEALYGSSGNAIDARGDLYQSNFNGNSIMRIRRTGEVETFLDEGLNGPVGLAFGASGDLFTANCSGGFISRATPDGVVTRVAGGALFACPNGLTFDDRGDLFVVNFSNTQVIRITPDGEASVFADIPGAGGNGHIIFAAGAFYVTKFRGHSIHRVTRDGVASLVSGDGSRDIADGTADVAKHSFPNGITANATGNVLYVNEFLGPQGAGLPTEIRIRRIRLITIADVLNQAGVDGDVDRIKAAWDAFHEARPWSESTTDAITTGYAFMSSSRVAAGIAIFEMNAERHSDVPAALFNLGEAYRYTGQMEAAAEQYRRTLAIAPDFPGAQDRLTMVGGG